MTTDRELDAMLAAAAGIHDDDLPALPEGLLGLIRSNDDSDVQVSVGRGGRESASIVAARQLVDDAKAARTRRSGFRPRSARRSMLRVGAAALAAAAAVVSAVLVPESDQDRSADAPPSPSAPPAPTAPSTLPLDPPGGLTLVAATALSFPYSLDPAPIGLTPTLGRYGGLEVFGNVEPVVFTARYRSASDLGFRFSLSSRDPRVQQPGAYEAPPYTGEEVVESSAVSIDGIPAEFVRATLKSPLCEYAPATPIQADEPEEMCSDAYADITWQRSDGLWVYLAGQGDRYTMTEALVAVAESIVDRPQPVQLQFGLAPEGWTVSSFESLAGLTLVDQADTTSLSDRIGISLLERWRGNVDPADALQGMSQGSPVEGVTVQGRAAELVSVPDPFTGPSFPGQEVPRRMWLLAAQFAGGPVYLLQAPDTLSREDVLAMAETLRYAP